MKKTALLLALAFFLASCSGAETIVKKKWDAHENTLAVVDLSAREDGFMDAGTRLINALEESLADTVFVLKSEQPRYQIKFKVTKYQEGNLITRLATMGLAESARAELQVKVALFEGKTMVGAWEVNSWVKGGVSKNALFKKAAKEIVDHLKGN